MSLKIFLLKHNLLTNSKKLLKPSINKIVQHRLYEKDFVNKCNNIY